METAFPLAERSQALAVAGQTANAYAADTRFTDFNSRKSLNTLTAYREDLGTFCAYLSEVSEVVPGPDRLMQEAQAWAGITWGLVAGFVYWLLGEGFAVASINRKLAAVKAYANLAAAASVISQTELALIRTVKGYGRKEARRIDAQRIDAAVPTRKSVKKAAPVKLTPGQAAALKAQPDTPQGRRDAVLLCLLLDHGLRVGEVAALQVGDFDVRTGKFTFYRSKVDKVQTHKMTTDTLRALAVWLAIDAPGIGPLLRGSRKSGALTAAGMTARSITDRVRTLGERIGIESLSAHDCRHYWATYWASRVDLFRLQEAGGWNSLAMPRAYVEWAEIANEGMA